MVPRVATDATAAVAQPKQRKQRAPPSKPPGMSNADWRVEVQRREAVTTDQRNRANAKKARDSAALTAAAVAEQAERSAEQAEAACAGMMNPPSGHGPYAPWSKQSVGSPDGFSSSPQPWACTPSPGYADGDTHGGFNPNITFPHGHLAQRTPSPAFAGVQYPPYAYSPPTYASSPTPPLRRGALPFSQASSLHLGDTDATKADMDDIITTGSAVVAASRGFTAQDDTMDLNGEEEPEEEEEEESVPAPARKGKKKKKGAARTGEPRIKWASKEDECLAEAWKVVCLDPIIGTNQSIDTYWDRIKAEFDERKLIDPYFKGVHMQRGSKAMPNHWGLIQKVCNKWHEIVEEIAARPESGASVEDHVCHAGLPLLVSACARPPTVVSRRSSCGCSPCFAKTVATKTSSTSTSSSGSRSARSGRISSAPLPRPRRHTSRSADGRPDGNKGAKKGKHAESATARVHESIEHCLTGAKTRAAQREEKTEARWSALMTNSAVKHDLLRTNVAAKKRNTDLAFLMGGADMSAMDEQVKAWYMAERGLILNQMSSTVPPSPTPPPSPSDDASTAPSSTEEAAPTAPSPRTPTPPTQEADTAV
ncbi:uncharacterized protein [Aegilops tauschii subsp. strangulata]|uniref:uncharacterized protein n=1 Tax=Aegilops tauschii subsp. strangulata TaxID=200361 RepID=UPI00098A4621|nr:uncharacterized protein LOC109778946 [Aegilops tauschii subsp. strangulata]